MGWLADRIGIRAVVGIGAVMMALGLAVSAIGGTIPLYLGHGLLIGLIGNGAIYAPLLIYVSRWFDRRRGAAIALISSGQYIAGVFWPSVFERGIAAYGWQTMMLGYAAVVLIGILPLLPLLRAVPKPVSAGPAVSAGRDRSVLGLSPNVVQAVICVAGFCCCIPMAIPNSHLVAFCSDIGIGPVHGAAMLSVLLGCAFISRQFWGSLADRIGGLRTVMVGIGLPGGGHRRLPADPERGRVVRHRRRLRPRVQRHHPILLGGDPRPVPVRRGVMANSDACCSPRCRAWRSAVGSPAGFTITSHPTRRLSPPAWCSTCSISRWSVSWSCACRAAAGRCWRPPDRPHSGPAMRLRLAGITP